MCAYARVCVHACVMSENSAKLVGDNCRGRPEGSLINS